MRRENYKKIEKKINLNKKHCLWVLAAPLITGVWHARPDV
jgi:hypothetical protein